MENTHYFKSRSKQNFVKLNDKLELSVDIHGDVQFTENALEPDWYITQGYRPIERAEFDSVYIKAVEGLNKFAAL